MSSCGGAHGHCSIRSRKARVGGDVQRCARQLGGKGFLGIAEVIVAVDEDQLVLVGQRIVQAANRHIGKAEIDRSLDVKLLEFLPASCVEHHGAGLAAHAHEVAFGQAMRLPVIEGLPGHTKITRDVDRRIGHGLQRLGASEGHDNERAKRDNQAAAPHHDLLSSVRPRTRCRASHSGQTVHQRLHGGCS